MSCPQCGVELENFNHQEGGWCPKCKTWFPLDIILEMEEIEDNDSFWGEEDDLDVDEAECEGIGDEAKCLGCPDWGGEGLCHLTLSREETSKRMKG